MRDSAPAAPGAPGPAPDAAHLSPLDAASQRLALDKHYVLGFSAVAFLSGVAGAMVYSAHTPPAAPQVGALRTAPTRQGLGVLHKTPQGLPAGVEAPAPDTSARSDGPLLAFGAFSLATAIVGGVSLAVVFAVRQALNISTVEEFADWMHANMPRIGRSSALARYVPAVATGPEPAGWAGPPPADLAERMNATEDPVEWAQLARLQLDHELAEHHAAREERRRLRAQHAQ
ncbi:hypothetical protein MOBT1_000861 [Malassezia obtusa]|uniref:Uncharacterized protein n=1 Tax=Malassezia obtusa TaxID=76774 RepID=A0AAF0IR25_9BASI|nr:hypothetical protein MOBT1_000861 [Malassezia obtusa]